MRSRTPGSSGRLCELGPARTRLAMAGWVGAAATVGVRDQ